MTIAEALAGLAAYFHDPSLIAALLVAVPLGMLAGVVPGLGGKLSIVMAIPFLVGIEPVFGAVFLLAMHSVVHTGGSIPSILFGVPGSGPDAATVVDGHPMARNGQAGRALGASLAASCIGGLIGAFSLALALPIVKPILLAFGPPEIFLLALLGITFIASVSGRQLTRGLMVGCFGLLIAFVGMDPIGGIARFTSGQLFLLDGVDLITAVIGLFAIPEMLALAGRKGLRNALPGTGFEAHGVLTGMFDVWRHRFLTLRASVIGTVIGVIPGLGGDVASWVAYGHAAQSSPRPEEFGTGRVEGVIAPESANNSKEGGSLLPTLFFGIPGSSGMAVMLGAFVMLGITPGSTMADQGLPLVWTLIWALVLANTLAVGFFLIGAGGLARMSRISGDAMFPYVLSFALLGSYLSALHWQTFVLLFVFGCLGSALKHHDWPRGPFAIGLVLGTPAEIALHQSMTIWGPSFLLRPLSLVLIALVIASVVHSILRYRRNPQAQPRDGGLVTLSTAGFGLALLVALTYPSPSSHFPLMVTALGLVLGLTCLPRPWQRNKIETGGAPQGGLLQADSRRRSLTWLAVFSSVTLVLGLSPGLPLALGLFNRVERNKSVLHAIGSALVLLLMMEGLFDQLLGMALFRGLLPM